MKVNTSISIDSKLKKEAQALFKELNMDMSSAVSLFLTQAVLQRGIPFSIGLEIPNEGTIAAINEYPLIKKDKETYRRYDSFDEILAEIHEEDLKYNTGKYKIIRTNSFKRDIRLAEKRGLDTEKLNKVVKTLANGEELPEKYKDHALIGDYAGFRECHIERDWLLIYRKEEEELELILLRNGKHSDLFK